MPYPKVLHFPSNGTSFYGAGSPVNNRGMRKALSKGTKTSPQEVGCVLDVELASASLSTNFLEEMVSQVESLGCFCGGGGLAPNLSLLIELGSAKDAPSRRLSTLTEWLSNHPAVKSFSVGPTINIGAVSQRQTASPFWQNPSSPPLISSSPP